MVNQMAMVLNFFVSSASRLAFAEPMVIRTMAMIIKMLCSIP